MKVSDIRITDTIKDEQKDKLVRLYFQAFKLKFSSLWLFTKDEDKAAIVLKNSIPFHEGIYAVQGDELLGFAGLEKGKQYYTHLSYHGFREAFGLFGATWRYIAYWIFRMFHSHHDEDVLHIDPLVVSKEARGMGIGTMLLEAAMEEAKKHNKKRVMLEVVDTNSDAKRLYERVGLQTVKEEDLSMLTKEAGFEKVYTMEKLVFA